MDKRVINGKDTRRKHSEALKRDLVERSLQAGASVSALAQEHGINANLLFNWRRLHLRAQGLDGATTALPTLLPVTVQPEMRAPSAPRGSKRRRHRPARRREPSRSRSATPESVCAARSTRPACAASCGC